MKEYFKTLFMYLIRILLMPLKIFPIKKNYIMFCTNSGKGFYCNPKYIYNYLVNDERFNEYKFIWCFENPNKYYDLSNKENTIICKYRSLKYYYYKVVSKLYISNSIEGNESPKKKEQIRIQTWHGGGCYKKVALSEKGKSKIFKLRTSINIKNTDLFISSSKIFSEIIHDNFKYDGTILECGMPRNDILLKKGQHENIRDRVINNYDLDNDSLIILYAPTWRYNEKKVEQIDIENIIKEFELKFNKTVTFLYRAHLHMKENKYKDYINVSNYEDMQELLVASDILITDYSSSMWDFSLMNKPCFLFCPDLEYYIEKRGFVIDIDKWGFPYCKSNEKFIENIRRFDLEDYKQKIKNHHKMLNSYENGTACEQVAKYIEFKKRG